jgi:hypothetical protein
MGWRDVVIFHDVRDEPLVREAEADPAQPLTTPDDDEDETAGDPEAVAQAMRDYLTWELALVAQIERDGDAGFLRFD